MLGYEACVDDHGEGERDGFFADECAVAGEVVEVGFADCVFCLAEGGGDVSERGEEERKEIENRVRMRVWRVGEPFDFGADDKVLVCLRYWIESS